MDADEAAELYEVAEWLDALYIRLQGAELMFATKLENLPYIESLQADIDQAVQMGIAIGRQMETCGLLFETLANCSDPREQLPRSRVEINSLAIAVRQLAASLRSGDEDPPLADPFERFVKQREAQGTKPRRIAEEWYRQLTPKEKHELTTKVGKSEADAIESIYRRIEYLHSPKNPKNKPKP